MSIHQEKGRAWSTRTLEEEFDILKGEWDSFSPEEKAFLIRIIEGEEDSLADFGRIAMAHYDREPVDIITFLEDEYYSGPAGRNLYPELKNGLYEIFTGNYSEVLLTGSIGWGKSFLASYGILYSMYRITCLRNPQETFGLAAGTQIFFAMLSKTKIHAKMNIFADLKQKAESSPYFCELGSKWKNEGAQVSDAVSCICHSNVSNAVIGLNIFGAAIDEVNFGDATNIDKAMERNRTGSRKKTKVEIVYDSILRRIKSRYMRRGAVPGVLFVLSSKNTDRDFTQVRIKEGRDDPRMYVMDFAEWDPKPPEKYSGSTFKVFFGGRKYRSRIMLDGEEMPQQLDDDMAHVIDVPVEYRQDFRNNVEDALRDIAGVSVPRISPFIHNTEAIHMMSVDRKGEGKPTKDPNWVCGDDSPFVWPRLAHKEEVRLPSGITESVWEPIRNPEAVRHIHIDPSLTQDATGFVMGHIARYVDVIMRDNEGNLYPESLPLIHIDVILRIIPPPTGEIKFYHLRRLVYELAAHGFTIGMISMDSFQSASTLQEFRDQGYTAELRSLDTSSTGYTFFKEALYQNRYSCYSYPLLESELEELEYDALKDKVDHPPNGSKDVSDSAAGVAWTLSESKTTGFIAVVAPESDGAGSEHPLDQWQDVKQGRGVVEHGGFGPWSK